VLKLLPCKIVIFMLLFYLGAFLFFTNIPGYIHASPANGDSGSSGSGDSAGNDGGSGGGGSNDSGGYDSGYSGGNATDGGSGGGSNQNDTGDEGSNSNSDNVGSIGGEGAGPKTLSGYIYNDLDRSSTFNSGDAGIASETIHLIRPASFTPEKTDPPWQEVTGTDENGNPTGWVDHPAVYHPAVYTPETLYAQAQTDANGFYVINNLPYNNTFIVKHVREPLWQDWVRTTPQEVTVTMNTSHYVRYGMVQNVAAPVNGGWSDWGACSVSCGTGVQTRSCSNPPPSGGGAYCSGSDSQVCYKQPCGFSQYKPLPLVCDTPNNSRILLSWDKASNDANQKYRVYYMDSTDGVSRGGWDTNGATSFTVTGLSPGKYYGFIIEAYNGAGSSWSSGGVWSQNLFGWIQSPDCAPPGPFNLTSSPAASCPSINNPNITLSWGPPGSGGATQYTVIYRDTADNQERTYATVGTNLSAVVTGLIANHSYYFLVVAKKTNTNPYNNFEAYSNNAWSSPVVFPDCSPPSFRAFNMTSGSNSTSPGNAPLTIKQTEPFSITWDVTNTNSCTASSAATKGDPLTLSIYKAWVSNPKPVSGSHSFSQNQITSKGDYNFTLVCTNPWNAGISNEATMTLYVKQLRNPYIEYQGDFHTNESVNISEE
jgi:hypothetical protein